MSILILTGPTAAGKTAAAMALAHAHRVRLISVDSAMVYRGLDIGSAKPSPAELARYPHALIDIRDPAEPYTVSEFVADADAQVRAALDAGETPVLVGGTMMYLQAFREGLDQLPRTSAEVREHVKGRAAEEGWPALHEELKRTDPVAAERIHPNNPQRLARALEVQQMTGQPISSFWGKAPGAAERFGCAVRTLVVDVSERAVLHRRIEQRLDIMLEMGLLDEVAGLRERSDLHADLPAMRAVGYRQVWQHLDGDLTLEEMRDRVLTATRTLARRQYTWIRRWDDAQTVQMDGSQAADEALARLAFR